MPRIPLPPEARPGIPNPWDTTVYDPYEPEDPGAGSTGGCGPGMEESPWSASGDLLPGGQKECVDPSELRRRMDLNIGKNPNGGEPRGQAAPAGTGPKAPAGPAQFPFSPVPGFKAPQFVWDEVFQAPSYEDAAKDPGYQFRLNEGRRALEQSAAGRGTLRTGGTLKDILNYGQNAASQEYGNVFDRYARGYDTRFNTAKDKFGFKYTGAKDEYAPKLFEWQTKTAFGTQAARDAYDKAWQDYWRNTLSASDIFNAGR